jgi:hypothetical protein
MRKQLITTAIAAACFVLGAGGATLYTHADTGPAVFEIYENNVTDEAAYKAALPEAVKFVKDNGGEYLAGGFNKTKRGIKTCVHHSAARCPAILDSGMTGLIRLASHSLWLE